MPLGWPHSDDFNTMRFCQGLICTPPSMLRFDCNNTSSTFELHSSHSDSVSVLRGIRHVVWVDSSVWFSAHEGRSFDSNISYMPSRLRRAYVLADGIFYLPKWFDLVSVIPWVYHGFDPRISSNSFWPSFISPGITNVHSQCVSFSLSF